VLLQSNTKIFNVKGIGIFLHWSIIFLPVIAFIGYKSVFLTFLAFFLSIVIVVVHELGHVVPARVLKINVSAVVFHFLGGYCVIKTLGKERDQIIVAWGGILFQSVLLVIALCFLSIVKPSGISGHDDFRNLVFERLIGFNLFIIILNLAPFPGLDGEKAWKAVSLVRIFFKSRKKIKQPDNSKMKAFDNEIERIIRSANYRK
jgi:Zn-dependent protease